MTTTDAPQARTRIRMLVAALLVAATAALIDQGTKALALARLSETERIPVLGELLGLQLAFNPGTVMSIGAGSTWIFTILASAASVALVIAATRARSIGWAVAIGLVLGGAVGNLLDRLFAPPGFGVGHVTDFLAYGSLFIGNLADVILGIGVGLGILLFWRHHRAQSRAEAASETSAPEADAEARPDGDEAAPAASDGDRQAPSAG